MYAREERDEGVFLKTFKSFTERSSVRSLVLDDSKGERGCGRGSVHDDCDTIIFDGK